MSLGVAIVGCGLIGRKRAAALDPDRLVACADIDAARAADLATASKAIASTNWREVITRTEVDCVIVATTNDALAAVTIAALEAGKHVLVEKPAARTLAELDRISAAARANDRLVHVGFNHRYHPAVLQARQLVETGVLGPLMFARGRYGHGGRLGYEREWRADPVRSGGGELIDQGVHLIDLAGWFLGTFQFVDGFATTLFWNMPVDDNAFMTLRTADGKVAFLHASCTEWKNLFSFELYGREGKLAIEGLGGSYGEERLVWYKMLPAMGPPEVTVWEFPGADTSWRTEWAGWVEDIRLHRAPAAGLETARAALAVVEAVYARSGYNLIAERS